MGNDREDFGVSHGKPRGSVVPGADHLNPHPEPKVKRQPVDWIFTALNPEFIRNMARIAKYASEKYGSWSQYTAARLDGEKSCVSHAIGHLMSYQLGEAHDKFGDPKWHLVACAYNCMMQFFYHEKFGPEASPWTESKDEDPGDSEPARRHAVYSPGSP